MTLHDDLTTDRELALAFAESLERELGDAALLTVGLPCASVAEVLDEEGTTAVAQGFSIRGVDDGVVAIVVCRVFAETLERVARDELVATACGPALESAVQTIGSMAGAAIESDRPRTVDLGSIVDAGNDGDIVVFPILEATEAVACFVVVTQTPRAVPEEPARPVAPVGAPRDPEIDLRANGSVVLTNVEMAVTAELGRCRMTIRELLSMTPGSVLDLDRTVGTPVDVLVNGTVVARGEVVVIDEEFGVRISEILEREPAPR